MRNKKKAVTVVVKMFGDPLKKEVEEKRNKLQGELAKLKAEKEIIPYKNASLFREFNKELAFGTPKKAEEHRTAISRLEAESRDLELEIKRLEKGGVGA